MSLSRRRALPTLLYLALAALAACAAPPSAAGPSGAKTTVRATISASKF